MIAPALVFDQQTLAVMRELDPGVQHYRTFFALLNWTPFLSPELADRKRGEHGHPKSAYIKALLVKLCEGKDSIPKLRTYLLQHPLLVLEVGFVPKLDPRAPYGFDIAQTVPKERWLRHQQQHLDHRCLQDLFHHTVVDLQAAIPGLGETVAVDVTPISAWVKQNNLRDYVTERFNPALQPSGDPDCRLGVKRSTNQQSRQDSSKEQPADDTTPPKRKQGKASSENATQAEGGKKEQKEYRLSLRQWHRCRHHPRLWRCRPG